MLGNHITVIAQRVQNMGFGQDGRLWMVARGGQVQFSNPENEEWEEAQYPEPSTSWGLLDLAYRTPDEIWVSGGSSNLLCSFDGGKTWENREVEDVPSIFIRLFSHLSRVYYWSRRRFAQISSSD